MRELIYGRNPVFESLRAGRRACHNLRIAEGVTVDPGIERILDLCEARGVPVHWTPREQVERVHASAQGVVLEAEAFPYSDLAEILSLAEERGQPPFLLLLDSLQDPQNLGTLVRTAEAVGVHGVCLPPRQSAKVTPAVVSASSGAAEHMRIAQLNLAQAIRQLKEEGLWVIGLDHADGSRTPSEIDLSGPVALVVGNEGQGLRRLVRASCDLLLRLPMVGEVESMNAAVAGSIALYMAFEMREEH